MEPESDHRWRQKRAANVWPEVFDEVNDAHRSVPSVDPFVQSQNQSMASIFRVTRIRSERMNYMNQHWSFFGQTCFKSPAPSSDWASHSVWLNLNYSDPVHFSLWILKFLTISHLSEMLTNLTNVTQMTVCVCVSVHTELWINFLKCLICVSKL